MLKVKCLVIIVSFLVFNTITKAEAEHHHNDNHAAHVHGSATLTLALENDEMEIELESPAMNLIGFEHRASSAEEIQLVEKVEALLSTPDTLFSITGSKCTQQAVEVDMSGVLNEEHEHHEHDHSEHSHEDEEEHESHEDHEGHSEITAHYHFSCENINNITQITTRLFEHFPAMEKINAMWLTDEKQDASMLDKENTAIDLK